MYQASGGSYGSSHDATGDRCFAIVPLGYALRVGAISHSLAIDNPVAKCLRHHPRLDGGSRARDWGARELVLRDPDGYFVTFTQPAEGRHRKLNTPTSARTRGAPVSRRRDRLTEQLPVFSLPPD